ncbi:MAG: oligosaccharide flippase family protein, partial [Blautia sp.]|nr:oligosaccharide flippase family protein [Blautia sp.]
MEKTSAAGNYIYSLVYQALLVISPLITTPFITRTLGDTSLGAYGWTQSVCSYFLLLASLGISMYGQRETAYVQNDPYGRYLILKELLLLRGCTVMGSALPYIVLFCIQGKYSRLFLVHGLDLLAVIFDISWFLQGMENFKNVALRNAAVKIISVICIFLFIRNPEDVTLYAFIQSTAVLLGNLSLWICLPRYLYPALHKHSTIGIRRHILPVLELFLPQIAIQVYNEMDKTMLGMLSSDIRETAYYTQAQKITRISMACIKSIGAVMMPRVSYVFSSMGEEEAWILIRKMFRYVIMLGMLMMSVVIGTAASLVPWFLGRQFLPSISLLYVLGLTILFIAVSNVSGIQCLVPLKRQKAFNISVIGGAVVNLVSNMVLIPEHGALGASFGTLIAEFVVMSIQLFCIRKEILVSEILKDTWQYCLLGLFIMCT